MKILNKILKIAIPIVLVAVLVVSIVLIAKSLLIFTFSAVSSILRSNIPQTVSPLLLHL